KPIGTARLLLNGHIGRMAVLKNWRNQGVGSAMLQHLLDEMRNRGIQYAVLNAQITATDFYRRFGFQAEGEEFMEAGIPHIRMILEV
ncbi:MAG: GNAT family N-acetyltransferase, partial [Nitrosomonas sp.]|nr:GNAT family N-acetyltransferase [Nitrosomonas sp.]